MPRRMEKMITKDDGFSAGILPDSNMDGNLGLGLENQGSWRQLAFDKKGGSGNVDLSQYKGPGDRNEPLNPDLGAIVGLTQPLFDIINGAIDRSEQGGQEQESQTPSQEEMANDAFRGIGRLFDPK